MQVVKFVWRTASKHARTSTEACRSRAVEAAVPREPDSRFSLAVG
jgi:hypothetical protein